MYTPNPETEKLRREKEAAEKKIEQYKHQIQRLENRKKYYEDGERAKRTHRLCNLGGTVESIAPQVKDLTRTEMTELMEYIFGLEEVKRAISHMAITHISNINRAKVNTPGGNGQFDRTSPTPFPFKSYTLSAGPTPSV